MDPASNGTYQYFITLTSAIGFNGPQEDQVVQWHRRNCDKVFLARELHDSGAAHYHSVVCVSAPRQASKVTEKLVRLYAEMGIDWVKGISVKVKTVSDFVGCLHYVRKDLGDDLPILLLGWRLSWIKQQCIAGVKHIPFKMLRKDVYMIQESTAVAVVIRYASASGHPLTGKDSFMTVVCAMSAEGYRFVKIKKLDLFADVLASVGDLSHVRNLWSDTLMHM